MQQGFVCGAWDPASGVVGQALNDWVYRVRAVPRVGPLDAVNQLTSGEWRAAGLCKLGGALGDELPDGFSISIHIAPANRIWTDVASMVSGYGGSGYLSVPKCL